MGALETTNEPSQESDTVDHAATYGPDATKIVEDGYKAINSKFAHAKSTNRLPKGRLLVEVVHSPDWEMPNLMSTEQLETFQESSREYLPEGVLRAIWFILENVCKETRLVPAIVLDRKTGYPVVRLY